MYKVCVFRNIRMGPTHLAHACFILTGRCLVTHARKEDLGETECSTPLSFRRKLTVSRH